MIFWFLVWNPHSENIPQQMSNGLPYKWGLEYTAATYLEV